MNIPTCTLVYYFVLSIFVCCNIHTHIPTLFLPPHLCHPLVNPHTLTIRSPATHATHSPSTRQQHILEFTSQWPTHPPSTHYSLTRSLCTRHLPTHLLSTSHLHTYTHAINRPAPPRAHNPLVSPPCFPNPLTSHPRTHNPLVSPEEWN